jgi:hypothetical protein
VVAEALIGVHAQGNSPEAKEASAPLCQPPYSADKKLIFSARQPGKRLLISWAVWITSIGLYSAYICEGKNVLNPKRKISKFYLTNVQ